MEFPSRKTIKIIDGVRIGAAEEIIKLGEDAVNKIAKYNTIRNQYATDYEGYFTDLCEGKVKISKEFSEKLIRQMNSVYMNITKINRLP